MSKQTRALPGFNGVGAAQTATVRLPIGFAYEGLLLNYAFTNVGNILDQMTAVRLVANGKPLMDLGSAGDIDTRNQYDGRAAASQAGSGILVIDFTRYGMRTRDGEEFTRIGTGAIGDPMPISTLDLEIDIKAGATGSALSAKARRVAAENSGLVIKMRKFNKASTGAGVAEISDLPVGPGINRVFFGGHATTVIKSVVLERDGKIVWERTTAENELMQSEGVRVPQADLFVFDPSESGLAAEVLETAGVQDLRFKLDCTNAGQIPIFVEYIDAVGT